MTPDGRSILFTAKVPAQLHPDRVLASAIWRLDLTAGEEQVLLQEEGWSFRRARPSLDGSVIAIVGRQQDEPAYRPNRLGVSSITQEGASEPVWLTDEESFDLSVGRFEWNHSRSALLFGAAREGGFPLFTMGLEKGFI